MIFQSLLRTVQDDNFELSYTKVPFYLKLLQLVLYSFTRMYINTWYWSVVGSDPDTVQSWSELRSTFDVFVLLISK